METIGKVKLGHGRTSAQEKKKKRVKSSFSIVHMIFIMFPEFSK